jgi:hypothetical protein
MKKINAHRDLQLASGPAGAGGPGGPKTQTPRVEAVLVVVLAALIVLTSGGCSNEQVERYRAVNAELKAALVATEAKLAESNTLLTQLDEQIDATPDGPEKLAAVEARDRVAGLAEKAKTTVAQLKTGIEQSDAAISAALAGNTADAVQIGGRYAASQLPPPYSVYVLAGTSVLGGLLTYLQKRKTEQANIEKDSHRERAISLNQVADRLAEENRNTRDAAASVITSIEHEKGSDGTVDFQDKSTRVSLRSRMSTEGRRLVEDVRSSQPARLKALTTNGT